VRLRAGRCVPIPWTCTTRSAAGVRCESGRSAWWCTPGQQRCRGPEQAVPAAAELAPRPSSRPHLPIFQCVPAVESGGAGRWHPVAHLLQAPRMAQRRPGVRPSRRNAGTSAEPACFGPAGPLVMHPQLGAWLHRSGTVRASGLHRGLASTATRIQRRSHCTPPLTHCLCKLPLMTAPAGRFETCARAAGHAGVPGQGLPPGPALSAAATDLSCQRSADCAGNLAGPRKPAMSFRHRPFTGPFAAVAGHFPPKAAGVKPPFQDAPPAGSED
jgi:hypothetical protein